MSHLLARSLGLDTLNFGADGVRIGFERPFPPWLWLGLIVLFALASLWSYRRLEGPRLGRVALASLRTLALTTLLVLIAGPRLVERRESVEKDWVVVLADRSASMTIADAPKAGPLTLPSPAGRGFQPRQSREASLRAALERSWPMWRELSRDRVVLWMGFDAGAYELPVTRDDAGDAASVDLGEPTGMRTSLSEAIEQALQRTAARPVAGFVVLSDGRSIDEPSRADLRRLQALRIPVFAVPLGSPDPVGDLAIRDAQGPGVAFVNDLAPVRVSIERLGDAANLGGVVRLIDKATGLTLDEQPIPAAGADEIVLTTRPQDPGKRQWIVQIDPAGPDLIAGDNTAQITVDLIDRPLRTLYIDGAARWEQRYLKNLLLREKSVTSSNLILAPNRRYIQEGDVELQSLPISPEEWAQYDVVILGDVRPEVFTQDQLSTLREHIAVRGGGLIWIGGPSATPDAWRDTPLADLLPFTTSSAAMATIGEPVVLAPTRAADRVGVLQLGDTPADPWPEAISDPVSGWSMLRWAQAIDRRDLKPATDVLAVGVPVSELKGGAMVTPPVRADAGWPLVLSMRYGAGRVLYVATDEIWRWRYGRGEALPERFWLQLVRLLGRESLSRSQRGAILAVAPRRPTVNQPARISIELLDQSLIELDLASISVRLDRIPGAADAGELATPIVRELTLEREPEQPRRYSTAWAPTLPGRWRINATDAALAGLDLSTEAVVSLADDELRHPDANFPLLARLSDATQGRVVEPDKLDELASLLPNRQLRIVHEQYETLWDTPLALLTMLFLLTAEWVGRRIIRLI